MSKISAKRSAWALPTFFFVMFLKPQNLGLAYDKESKSIISLSLIYSY